MSIAEIFKADLRQWYWFFQAGKPKRKANFQQLRYDGFKDLPPSVFFLSTGRTGTAWFADLYAKAKNLIVFHQAVPSLAVQNKFYYNILKNNQLDEELKFKIGQEIFLAAREEYLLYSYKTNKAYLETNNDLVFFAEAIIKTLPNSKFVHLYRHPGDFVRSGLMRGWYKENRTLLKLIDIQGVKKDASRLEKIAYLWTEINSFIEILKEKYGKHRFFDFNFNNLSAENIKKLNNFLGVNLTGNQIKKHLEKKVNVSVKKTYPKYEDWPEEDKEKLRKICGSLAKKYGYKL